MSVEKTSRRCVKCKFFPALRYTLSWHRCLFNRARENQLRLRQEAQLNAPDIRESRPPCYEDALLLPKLDAASFASLDELLLRGKRKKKRRHRQSTGDEATDADDETDRIQLRQSSRSRSENVLSVRAVVYQEPTDSVNRESSPIYQRPTSNRPVVANVHPSPTESRNSRAQPQNDTELHYHSTDILRMDRPTTPSPSTARSITVSVHQPASPGPSANGNQIQDFNNRSYENSPYAKRKVKPLQHINPNGSIEEITDFEGYESSPYAKRRIQHMASFKGDRERPQLPERPPPSNVHKLLQNSDDDDEPGGISIKVVDDYFKPERITPELDDYAVVTEDDVTRNLLEREQQPGTTATADSSGSSSIEIIPTRNEQHKWCPNVFDKFWMLVFI